MTLRPALGAAVVLLAPALLLGLPARAQAPAPHPAAPAAAPGAEADPVVARVNGEALRLSDVLDVAGDMIPAEYRSMEPARLAAMIPPEALRSLTDRAVTERALVVAARAAGLDRDPQVERRVRRAGEQELQQAILGREVGAAVTDEALRARYEQESAGRRGEEEVQARHILLRTETEARQVITDLGRPGADFAAIARTRSTDPSGAQNGGDLGFFKKGDMVPEFAEAAFALQPGQTSTQPVRSAFGWHVIRVEARRAAPVPGFDEVRDALRQRMMEEQVDAIVQRIRAAARVEMAAPATPPARSLMDSAAPPAPPPAPQRR